MTTPPTPFSPPRLITQQLFSRRGIGYLYDHRNELDPGQVSIINSLWNNRKKGTLECQQTITYKLALTKAGKLGWGRYYGSKGGLETVEKECRGTLCGDYYYDLDIVNCHFVLLAQFAKNLFTRDLPEVERYIDNREEFLRIAGGDRETAKNEIIKILYGGTTKNEFLLPLSRETRNFSKQLSGMPQYAELFNAVKHEDNVYGTFLSYVLQTEERKCMLAMKGSLERQNWSVDVLCYDGLMIRKRDTDLNAAMRKTEQDVEAETGYRVGIVNKEMSSFEIPVLMDEVVKGVTRAAYETMKAEFEMNNFYYIPTNEFVEVRGREMLRMKMDHAREHYGATFRFTHSDKFEDYTTFFDVWRQDPKKRVIRSLDMKPSDDPSVFVLAPSFAWMEEAEGGAGAVEKFQELIRLFGNEAQQDYITKWLAQLIQKPFEPVGTSIVVTGPKGSGKDTPFDFFLQYVFGEMYSRNYTCGGSQFFDKHDEGRMNRFFCKVEEANPEIFRKNADKFKSIITANTETFNGKNQKPVVAANYNRFLLTCNSGCPVEMTDGERRFVILQCSRERKGDSAYWTEVRRVLFNKAAGVAVGKWLSEMDLGDFDFRKIPENEYQNAIIDSIKSCEELFLEQWDGVGLSACDFFNKYRDYCVEQNLPYAQNVKSLGFRLLPFIRDGKLKKVRKNSGFVYVV
jgi:hypothetical protein